MSDFQSIGLAKPILRALESEGYTDPTPIQDQAITPMMQRKDLLGIAQTGTGKTAAFALPTLHLLATGAKKALRREPRALILAPTRELAGQITDSIHAYSKELPLRSMVAVGGVSIRPQMQKLNRGVHILVATPGRLLDLMEQGHASLRSVQIFILDEADRMLDMGFIHDVRKIAAQLPDHRQTALFSATMPRNVKGLADKLLTNPFLAEVTPQATTVEKIEQQVLFVPQNKKMQLLIEMLSDKQIKRALVFARTKYGANRISEKIARTGIHADAIHGNKSQNARQKALDKFRTGSIRVLVATDIAARGIDVEGITHVINFDLPNEPENYVHRIGRTARAGRQGVAISFCQVNERHYLKSIEKVIRQTVPVSNDHPYHEEQPSKNEAKNKKSHAPGINKVKMKQSSKSRHRRRNRNRRKKPKLAA